MRKVGGASPKVHFVTQRLPVPFGPSQLTFREKADGLIAITQGFKFLGYRLRTRRRRPGVKQLLVGPQHRAVYLFQRFLRRRLALALTVRSAGFKAAAATVVEACGVLFPVKALAVIRTISD
jgi:hypothetical protein